MFIELDKVVIVQEECQILVTQCRRMTSIT